MTDFSKSDQFCVLLKLEIESFVALDVVLFSHRLDDDVHGRAITNQHWISSSLSLFFNCVDIVLSLGSINTIYINVFNV